uniref:ShKT domain-containing protein n=2 Tax=Lepeophtheirus salmonis TaxID=72036 RepID=A0A0K2T6K9_LEPSM|nr:uncharacterized protein LOC121122003 [Lepeophtheirus salmonis]
MKYLLLLSLLGCLTLVYGQMTKTTPGQQTKGLSSKAPATTTVVTTTTPAPVCRDCFPLWCFHYRNYCSYNFWIRKWCPKTCRICTPVRPCKNLWGWWCKFYRHCCNFSSVARNCQQTCNRCQ